MKDIDWLAGAADALETIATTDRHGKPLKVVVNIRTGLVRNEPIPSDAELKSFYSEAYRVDYKGAALPRKRQALRNFRRVAKFVEANKDIVSGAQRILDIGAGSGEFLFTMKEMGKDGRGIEPNRDYSQFCRDAYSLDVRTAHLESGLFEPAGYDFIRLNHVLEHLNQPVKYLEMIAGWLTPGGVLYVEVPNIEEYCRTKSRARLFHYGHIYNFNPWTLRAVASMAGLSEVAATASRCAHTTGVFLQRSAPVLPASLLNEQNGAHVLELVRQHAANGPAVSSSGKMLAKLSARIDEFFTTLGANSFPGIGRKVVQNISL